MCEWLSVCVLCCTVVSEWLHCIGSVCHSIWLLLKVSPFFMSPRLFALSSLLAPPHPPAFFGAFFKVKWTWYCSYVVFVLHVKSIPVCLIWICTLVASISLFRDFVAKRYSFVLIPPPPPHSSTQKGKHVSFAYKKWFYYLIPLPIPTVILKAKASFVHE